MNVIMEDDFSRCFANSPSVRWNWNTYLMILWLIGVVLRYCVLFPIRLACLLAGFSIFLCAFVTVSLTMKPGPRRSEWEKKLIRFLAGEQTRAASSRAARADALVSQECLFFRGPA
jgi:glycerol-3-phosphate O-acyltransferase 3/4